MADGGGAFAPIKKQSKPGTAEAAEGWPPAGEPTESLPPGLEDMIQARTLQSLAQGLQVNALQEVTSAEAAGNGVAEGVVIEAGSVESTCSNAAQAEPRELSEAQRQAIAEGQLRYVKDVIRNRERRTWDLHEKLTKAHSQLRREHPNWDDLSFETQDKLWDAAVLAATKTGSSSSS